MATIFGFSPLQGPHQEAQKSTIVIFPATSLSEISLPSGFGAEKFALHLAGAADGAGAAGASAFFL